MNEEEIKEAMGDDPILYLAKTCSLLVRGVGVLSLKISDLENHTSFLMSELLKSYEENNLSPSPELKIQVQSLVKTTMQHQDYLSQLHGLIIKLESKLPKKES